MDSEWTYYHEAFEFDEYHADLLKHSAWVGHRSFAYDLVRWMKPRRVVELGTHYSISFFTFCQGMRRWLGRNLCCCLPPDSRSAATPGRLVS